MPSADPNRRRRQRKPARRKNTKVTGEHSEAAFHYKAVHLEFGVARPWGDSLRYDFILDNGVRLFRIQVKCTETIRAQAYETRATYTTGKGRAVYTKKTSTSSPPTSSLSTSGTSSPSKSAPPSPCSVSIPTAKPKRCASSNTAKPGTSSNPPKTPPTWKSKPAPTKPFTRLISRAMSSRAKALLREADQHRSRGTLGLFLVPSASPNPPPPGPSHP
jgi:hypothetical protein